MVSKKSFLGASHLRWLLFAACLVALAVVAVGCGGGSSSSSSSPTEASTAEATGGANTTASSETSGSGAVKPDPEYNGPDKKYFGKLSAPKKKSGFTFTAGYLQIFGGQPVLKTMQESVESEVSALGGKTIVKDAELNPQKQVSEFEELISQKVNVILAYPVVVSALGPSLAKAKAAGIPVIATNTPPNVEEGANPAFVTNIGESFDYGCYSTVKEMAKLHPGGTFAVMGTALPVSSLIYMTERMKYWGEKLGLKFVGESDAQEDTPAGYGPAISAILAQNPEVEMIFTYNDESALAAATTAGSQGKTDIAIADPNDGQTIAEEGIKKGQLAVVYRTPWEELGEQMAIAGYDVLTKQNLPLPKMVNLVSTVVTKENVDSIEFTG
jgi:ABC-type sugar transport system substrate-binding protein